jgi:hypothetical protein
LTDVKYLAEVVGMGPTSGIRITTPEQRARDDARWLAAARAAFGGRWDFHEVMTGWFAVPAGTPVIHGMDIDSVVGKLRRHEAGG